MLTDLTFVCAGPLAWREPLPLLWLLLGAPLLEEWVLRAGLQEFLLRRAASRPAPIAAASLVSLAFFALHLGRGAATAAMTLPMSLGLGLLYARRRNWLACAALHALSNVLVWRLCLPYSL